LLGGLEYGADMSLSNEQEIENVSSQETISTSDAKINLAAVVIVLEKTRATIQDLKDNELYVFDLYGNKVLL
jgi:hypothetical protein